MKKLTDTPILKFNPHTLEEVRRQLSLDREGVLEQMIENFEEWISKQNHFIRRSFDRHYLETSIILGKGYLERAKDTLDKLCTLKTLLPHFFSKYDAKNDLRDATGFLVHATMPKLLKDNYRLYIMKFVSSDFNPEMFLDICRFTVLMSEYVKSHDYSHGFVCVVDCRDINLVSLVTKFDILDLRNCMSVLIEGYSMRIKAIHLISKSKAINTMITLLKQVISPKIGDRITVHKDVESLQEHIIPKEVLPAEYGGAEAILEEIHESWENELSTKDNVAFFEEILKAGTDEKLRLTENYNDQILGMPGSFRTLTVD